MIQVTLYLYQALLAVLVQPQDLNLFQQILVLVLALVQAALILIIILTLNKALLRIIGSWERL